MTGASARPSALRRAPAPLAGDEFELIAALPDDERLDDAVLFDRVDEFIEMVVAKNGARLERRGDDLRERYELHALAAFNGGSGRRDARIDERAETFAECSFCHRSAEAIGAFAKGNGGR